MLSENERAQTIVQENTRALPLRKRLLAAAGLFFLAPLVGEFLLGNLPITWLWVLPMLALFYGGGALLVRESARRLNLNWAGIVLLALAYAVIEEAFVTQSLFNPNFLGMRLLDYGYIPSLGISIWWTVFVLGIHTVWSISVPIALIESLSPRMARVPWFGPVGLIITALLFLAGTFLLASTQQQDPFMASSGQFIGSGVVVVGLIIAAVTLGGKQTKSSFDAKQPPRPFKVGLAMFLLSSGFMGMAIVHNIIPAVVNVLAMLGLAFAAAAVLWRWSSRSGWSNMHRFAAAAGLVLTYIWYSFIQVPSTGDTNPGIDAAGNVIFALAALILLAIARKRAADEVSNPDEV